MIIATDNYVPFVINIDLTITDLDRAMFAHPDWSDVALAWATADNVGHHGYSDEQVAHFVREAEHKHEQVKQLVLRAGRRLKAPVRPRPCMRRPSRSTREVARPKRPVKPDAEDPESRQVRSQERAAHEAELTAAGPHGQASDALTVEEGAEFLRIGVNQLYEACGRGEVPHRRLGRRILLSRTALVRWLEGSCEVAATKGHR